MQTFTKVGPDALLTPENGVLLLIDHQPFQLARVNSHEPTMVVNNVTGLAKMAKVYGIPTVLTVVVAERGGEIFEQVQAVFPECRRPPSWKPRFRDDRTPIVTRHESLTIR
jgi:nicotinamidase-related amidase